MHTTYCNLFAVNQKINGHYPAGIIVCTPYIHVVLANLIFNVSGSPYLQLEPKHSLPLTKQGSAQRQARNGSPILVQF